MPLKIAGEILFWIVFYGQGHITENEKELLHLCSVLSALLAWMLAGQGYYTGKTKSELSLRYRSSLTYITYYYLAKVLYRTFDLVDPKS